MKTYHEAPHPRARKRLAAALFLAALLGAQTAHAQSVTRVVDAAPGSGGGFAGAPRENAALDPDETVRLALARSQRIVGNRAQVEAARERAVAAGKRPDPMFTTGLQAVPLDGPDRWKLHNDSFTMTTFGIKQELTSRDKLAARSERYAREADSAEAARVLSEAEIARDARLAWIACSYLQSAAALLSDEKSEVEHQIEAADAAYRGGRGTQSDALAMRTERARVADREIENAHDLSVARAWLERWIGPAAERPLVERASFSADPSLPASPDGLHRRIDTHPALKRLAAQEAAARAEAEVARTERSADWSVELAAGLRRPTYSNLGTINFSIPIPWDRAGRQDRELAARLADADAVAAEREEASRIATSELRSASDAWHHDRERLHRYDIDFIPLAAQRSSAALAAWRGGTGTLSAVLDARRSEVETRLDRLKLERSLAETAVRLDYWLGDETSASGARAARGTP